MPIHPKINKALFLLDRGKPAEAEVFLREALDQAARAGDGDNMLRSSCILGDLLYSLGRVDEARPFLERVAAARLEDDTLEYEIRRARELLKELNR